MHASAIFMIIMVFLVLVMGMSTMLAAASGKRQLSQSQTAAAAAGAGNGGGGGVAPTLGRAVADPSQGGQCSLLQQRPNACGTINCQKLPSCPTYKWMGLDNFQRGKIDVPTGITNKSAALTNGLDPQGILDMVNKCRQQVGSPPVKWDDRLACAAAAWLPITNYDTCPHGAAPGFPYYAQVIGSSVSLTQTPMQVAQYAIEVQFFAQEKAIADQQKIAPNSIKADASGWKRGTLSDPKDDRIGHYIIMCTDEAKSCGFAFGYNYTGSGYTSNHMTKVPLVVGHFAI